MIPLQCVAMGIETVKVSSLIDENKNIVSMCFLSVFESFGRYFPCCWELLGCM